MQPFASTGKVRKELEDGLWIDIKEEMSYGDGRALRKAILDNPGDPEAVNVRLIEITVVGWSLGVTVDAEMIDLLSQEMANSILKVLDAYYRPQGVTPEEKKP